MKKTLFLFSIAFLIIFGVNGQDIKFETSEIIVGLNEKGFITNLTDKVNNTEYLADSYPAPLISIQTVNGVENPAVAKFNDSNIFLQFNESKVQLHVSVVLKKNYMTLELLDVDPVEKVDLIIWGPYPTRIKEIIGESVGVVRNDKFAIGIQALNVKTLGGYPSNENDIEPSYNIFSTNNLIDIDESVKFLYRGQTAKKTDFGSVLQAYCRNREHERIISNWGHSQYVAPAFNDGGVIGSKIALFGCLPEKVLDVIEHIEIEEGLPHPVIDGQWAKKSTKATSSYLIINFSEESLDRAIGLTQKAGLEFLYHGDPFKTWGHFKLKNNLFPDNWESMKRCVERAKARGIKLGVHTLSNFITTNDAYVTPVPDRRLAVVGESILSKEINSTDEVIYIESPVFFNQMENNSLKSVLIGNEIIRYQNVSVDKPWRLTGCTRGAFNTVSTSHGKGANISKLMDHGYKVFLSNTELSIEIAETIADFFNETGLKQISFDGLEGVWSTGMGQYARSLFTKTWYDHLSTELRGKVINDASNPSHYNWHINTRYNWGEPWYAGFRESQTMYRLMNQDFYRRNLLPAMLGWFNMSSQTSLEDVEWLLARAAGFDAGFAFNLNFDTIEKNGISEDILKSIKTWENARMAGVFSKELKLRMENINNEFHLNQVAENKWELFPYNIKRFIHNQKLRQPGEPLSSSFTFENIYEPQPVIFIIKSLSTSNQASASNISIEVNNSQKMEIPIEMNPGEILKLDLYGNLRLYDKTWNLISEVEFKGKIPMLEKGNNLVIIDAEFKGEDNSLEIEMKTKGSLETLTSVTSQMN
ncbi:MAG TPA: hypothetical protein DEB12_05410 [Porphyromonadaceae bacterium]|jgi:hypothetical protein|nr:hypothetical protein [Porphyromonadaceae bacterium]